MAGISRHGPAQFRRPNIVWIDDNIEDYHLQVANLAITGKQVFCCKTVGEFLQVVNEYLVDVAVIDLKLRGIEKGEDLIEHMSDNHKNTKVIVHSHHVVTQDDGKIDGNGTLFLAADASEQMLMPGEKTKIQTSVDRVLELKSSEVAVNPPPKPEKWATIFDRSWQNLVGYGRNALQRILPVLAFLNVLVAISVNWDRDLVLFNIALSNIEIILSFAAFSIVSAIVVLVSPKEIRKIPSRSSFIDTKLLMYEKDSDFARDINNQLESFGVNYEPMEAFERLSVYYQHANSSMPRVRMLTFVLFWAAVILISAGTVLNFVEFAWLFVDD